MSRNNEKIIIIIIINSGDIMHDVENNNWVEKEY
jgi:hypothetical protein